MTLNESKERRKINGREKGRGENDGKKGSSCFIATVCKIPIK
jgi:hypothetical protein